MKLLRILVGWLYLLDEQGVRLGRLIFPQEQRAVRRSIVLWAFLLIQVAIFALVISGESFGCR